MVSLIDFPANVSLWWIKPSVEGYCGLCEYMAQNNLGIVHVPTYCPTKRNNPKNFYFISINHSGSSALQLIRSMRLQCWILPFFHNFFNDILNHFVLFIHCGSKIFRVFGEFPENEYIILSF